MVQMAGISQLWVDGHQPPPINGTSQTFNRPRTEGLATEKLPNFSQREGRQTAWAEHLLQAAQERLHFGVDATHQGRSDNSLGSVGHENEFEKKNLNVVRKICQRDLDGAAVVLGGSSRASWQ
jgi:hypothetical protein